LWFYAWWYAGNLIADILGVSPMLGPIMGLAAALLFVGDPRRLIWARRTNVGVPPEAEQASA